MKLNNDEGKNHINLTLSSRLWHTGRNIHGRFLKQKQSCVIISLNNEHWFCTSELVCNFQVGSSQMYCLLKQGYVIIIYMVKSGRFWYATKTLKLTKDEVKAIQAWHPHEYDMHVKIKLADFKPGEGPDCCHHPEWIL